MARLDRLGILTFSEVAQIRVSYWARVLPSLVGVGGARTRERAEVSARPRYSLGPVCRFRQAVRARRAYPVQTRPCSGVFAAYGTLSREPRRRCIARIAEVFEKRLPLTSLRTSLRFWQAPLRRSRADRKGRRPRGAEFPGFGLLLAGDGECALEVRFRFRAILLRTHQRDFAGNAINLGLEPCFFGGFSCINGFADAAPSVVEVAVRSA